MKNKNNFCIIPTLTLWSHETCYDTHTHTVEDTVAEVYKDFEVAALVDPERMKRRSLVGSSDTASIGSRELK